MIIALGDSKNRKVLTCNKCQTIFTYELSDLDVNRQLECPQCGHKCNDVPDNVIYSKSYNLYTDNDALVNDYIITRSNS